MIKLSQTIWELWPAEDFGFRGDNYITKTVRVVSLACATPTGPPQHSYQIISKYVQGYRSYGAHKDAFMDRRTGGQMDGCHADRFIPRTYRSEDKKLWNKVFQLLGHLLYFQQSQSHIEPWAKDVFLFDVTDDNGKFIENINIQGKKILCKKQNISFVIWKKKLIHFL